MQRSPNQNRTEKKYWSPVKKKKKEREKKDGLKKNIVLI